MATKPSNINCLITISDNGTLNISNNHHAASLTQTFSDLANHIMSGIIAIKHTNSEPYAKSLYVSGVPIKVLTTQNITKLFSTFRSATLDPSLAPTTDPTHPSLAPTINPTGASIMETFVVYVVNITIILKDTPSINITSAIINLINKTANIIIAQENKDCLDKDNFTPKISAKYKVTVMNVSIEVCDEETLRDLYIME